MAKKMSQAMGMMIIVVVGFIAFAYLMTNGFTMGTIFATDEPEQGSPEFPTTYQQVGQAATIYFNSYDNEADAKTEVYPTYTIYKGPSTIQVDGAVANSSSGFVVGDTTSIYGTGTTYYLDPVENGAVNNEAPTFNMNAHTIATVASVEMKAYDTAMSELAASANDSDYNMTLGASEEKPFYVKVDTNQANVNLRIKAFCTFGSNMTDGADLKIATGKDTVAADWTKETMPKEVSTQTLSIKDRSGAVSMDYDACYVYKKGTEEYIDLHEWDEYWMKWTIEAGTKDPVDDLNSLFGMIWVDYSYSKGKDNKVYHDFYKHDDNEQVSTVGATETLSSPMGADNGLCFVAI